MSYTSTNRIYAVVLYMLFQQGYCRCIFDGEIEGSWTTNKTGTIIITNETITLGALKLQIFNVSSYNTAWNCYIKMNTLYAVSSEDTVNVSQYTGRAFMCLNFTRAEFKTYILYVTWPQMHMLVSKERVSFWALEDLPGNLQDVCAENSGDTDVFYILIRNDSVTTEIPKLDIVSLEFTSEYGLAAVGMGLSIGILCFLIIRCRLSRSDLSLCQYKDEIAGKTWKRRSCSEVCNGLLIKCMCIKNLYSGAQVRVRPVN